MKKSLTIPSANLLYLVTMLLIILVGSMLQVSNLSLGVIATELLLILLPTLIFLWIAKVPLKEGLRLNRISVPVAVLSVFLGVCTYLFSVLIELAMANLTGLPSVDLSQSTLPQGVWPSVLYAVAIAVSAPICEEVLFRGALQGSYEGRKSALFAIVVPAVMFAFYHFRLSGLPGLIPVAFLLGYVAWRTRSIFASILIHFGMNAAAATVSVLAFNGSTLPNRLFDSVWISLIGFILALVLLFIFIRIQPKPERAALVDEPAAGWLKKYWALIVAGILYVVIVVATLFAQLSGQTASKTLTYEAPDLQQAVTSRYVVYDPAGEEAGEMTCLLEPKEDVIALACQESITPFEVQKGSSYFKETGHTAELEVVWDRSTLDVKEYQYEKQYDNGMGYTSELTDGMLGTTSSDRSDVVEVPDGALLDHEWHWRVNHLEVSNGLFFKPSYISLDRWDDALQQSAPAVTEEVLHVQGEEKLDLPFGKVKAWKVSLAGQTVWFDSADDAAPLPVKIDDGMLVYLLAGE